MVGGRGLHVTLLLLLFGYTLCDDVEIDTKPGKVKGVVVKIGDKSVAKFLGVPYAKPPVGPLRFQLPQPIEKYEAPIDATKPAPICPQMDPDKFEKPKDGKEKEAAGEMGKCKNYCASMEIAKEFKDVNQSEDCLVLNIFAPSDIKPDSKRGVIVAFHGGLFQLGGIAVPSMDGSVLAGEGDVVVVFVQYRLAAFGFLYCKLPEIPGNMGLHDQRQAIQWVHDNIAAFGGDPEKISVWGHDAGGMSVGFHMLSADSTKLINSYIMASGNSLEPFMLFGEPFALTHCEMFVEKIGCPIAAKAEKDGYKPMTKETFECLSKKTLEEIQKAEANMLQNSKCGTFLPSQDQKFFGGNVNDLIKKKPFSALGKKVLAGSGSNEGALFVATGMSDVLPPCDGEPKPMILSELIDYMKKKGGSANGGQMQMMFPMFFRGVNKKDPVAVRKRLIALVSDGLFTCGMETFINSYCKEASNLVYVYNINHRPTNTCLAKWVEGTVHMEDIPFFMGRPLDPQYKAFYDEKEVQLSKNCIHILSTFATKGKPKCTGAKWLPNKMKKRFHLELSAEKCTAKKKLPPNICKDLTRYLSMGRSFLKTYKCGGKAKMPG